MNTVEKGVGNTKNNNTNKYERFSRNRSMLSLWSSYIVEGVPLARREIPVLFPPKNLDKYEQTENCEAQHKNKKRIFLHVEGHIRRAVNGSS